MQVLFFPIQEKERKDVFRSGAGVLELSKGPATRVER